MPAVEMVRFVNSGTEATMAAVRVARAAARRDLVLKFDGCYHGHSDGFLVKAGSGVATLGLPDSPGVPAGIAGLTLSVPFNDVAAVEEVFQQRGADIAAVIVEPFVGNVGFIPPEPQFHPALRRLCDRHGALLIFDEVMTGFRVAPGGAQERLGIRPDLTTLGKIIGGGLPVGAYGGRGDLMDLVAPAGPVYQAGTLSGHPVVMAAGEATLAGLTPDVYAKLERQAGRLASRLSVPHACVTRVGSLLTVFFRESPPMNFAEAKSSDTRAFARFFHLMLEAGVLLPPSQFEAWFVSAAHDDGVIQATLAAASA